MPVARPEGLSPNHGQLPSGLGELDNLNRCCRENGTAGVSAELALGAVPSAVAAGWLPPRASFVTPCAGRTPRCCAARELQSSPPRCPARSVFTGVAAIRPVLTSALSGAALRRAEPLGRARRSGRPLRSHAAQVRPPSAARALPPRRSPRALLRCPGNDGESRVAAASSPHGGRGTVAALAVRRSPAATRISRGFPGIRAGHEI